MSLYLKATVLDKDVKELQAYVDSLPEVTGIEVVSREDVIKSFQERHKLNKDVLQALTELGGNPFGPTMVVTAHEPEEYQKIITALNVPEYSKFIESKSFDQHEEILGRIQTITNRVETIGFGLTVLFGVIAFFIIFNTIRVAIVTQRTEISIKRLVGANNWFIQGPYFVTAIIFTLISTLISALIMWWAVAWLDRYVGVVFGSGFSLTNYLSSHMLYLFGLEALAALLLTICSSSLAMRRQLRV
jgi:cell division transport system permease protein